MPRLVRMILHRQEVKAQVIREARRFEHALRIVGVREQEVAELKLVAVITHRRGTR
jgi:hypothetical protein